MGESIGGSVGAVVVQSQKGHPSKIGWSAPSGASRGLNLRRFRTGAVVVDEGDVAVYAVKSSLSDASASGLNHQNLGEDH
jgi:hypothetical protein